MTSLALSVTCLNVSEKDYFYQMIRELQSSEQLVVPASDDVPHLNLYDTRYEDSFIQKTIVSSFLRLDISLFSLLLPRLLSFSSLKYHKMNIKTRLFQISNDNLRF